MIASTDRLASSATRDQLKARLSALMSTLPLQGEKGLVSLILTLPYAPAVAPVLPGPGFQLLHGDRDSLRAGYGQALDWHTAGSNRLYDLGRQIAASRAHWDRIDPDATGLDAFSFAGFAAGHGSTSAVSDSDLPNTLLTVPEIAIRRQGKQAAVILTGARPTARSWLEARWRAWLDCLIPALEEQPRGPQPVVQLDQSGQNPDPDTWNQLVESALETMATGPLEKVVLARKVELTSHRPFDLKRLLQSLSRLFPSCQIVHIRRGGTDFIAATPERLVARTGNRIEVDAIAGTAGRSTVADQDMALGAGLQSSEKNHREHMLVREAVQDALVPYSSRVDLPARPQLLQLSNAQHLWSPVRATIPVDVDLLELATRLHPTPATNGHPRVLARNWLAGHEPITRDWYTGAAGILEPDQTGELWVLLRCARIQDRRAILYAGAGIVPGSEPTAEWGETEAKLAAMRSALTFA